jgi:predicted AAA+ superfamily ATPase
MPKISHNLNLNINKDDSNINDFIFCWNEFGSRPSKVTLHNTYITKSFIDIIDNLVQEENTFTEIIPSDDQYIINDKILAKISEFIYLSYVVIDREHESSMISDLVFYYKSEDNSEEVLKIVNDLESCVLDFCEDEVNKLNSIILSTSGLDIEPIDSNIDVDLMDLYYNSSTRKGINKLIKQIKKSDNGLCILYGDRGTGKTSAITHIANKLDRIVMFIPNNMMEHTINNPDFKRFLKKYHKPIIVLDDCEMMFSDYFSKANVTVNNLLQMVDGFQANSLDATFILLFNSEDDSEIDHTLLDSNNLIDVIEFEYLEADEAKELASHLGDKVKFKNKTRLIDIIRKKSNRDYKQIGF